MATKAEQAVNKGGVPSKFKDNAAEVSSIIKDAFVRLESEEEDGPLHFRLEHHGLHAYQYQELDDGSVLVLWSNDKEGTVRLKAFENMEEASKWSPRDERG